MSDDQVTIVLANKRFDINLRDKASIQAMPWKDRKQLIDLLETIKQAEHIKRQVQTPKEESKVKTVQQIHTQDLNTKPQLDPAIKPSEADIDSMMERFVMEGQKDRPKIPDKNSIYKWLIIVLAAILLLAIVF